MIQTQFPTLVKLYQKSANKDHKEISNPIPADATIYHPPTKTHMLIFFNEVIDHKVYDKDDKKEFVFLLKLHRDS